MRKVLIVACASLLMAACSAQQDAAVSAKLTKINGDVSNLVEVIKQGAQQSCPWVIAAAPTTAMGTQAVASLIGMPTTGQATVQLEIAVANFCGKLEAQEFPDTPATPAQIKATIDKAPSAVPQ